MKKNQLKNKFKFSYFKYPKNNNLILNDDLINSLVDMYFNKVIFNLGDKVAMIQLIIESQKIFRSLSTFINVSKDTDKNKVKTIFKERIHQLNENYYDLEISSIFIRYKYLDTSDPLAVVNFVDNKRGSFVDLLKYYNLPSTMQIDAWKDFLIEKSGYNLIRESNHYLFFYDSIKKIHLSIDILERDKTHEISLTLDGVNIFSFKEKVSDADSTVFIREMNNGNIIHYKDGKQVMFYPKQRPVAFMKLKEKDKKVTTNFITLDLETRTLSNSNLEVISASFFDGLTYYTYFLSDYANSQSMLKSMIKDLFLVSKKQESTRVYIHNFSNFDSVFLLNLLAVMSSTFNIIKRDDNIISLHVSKKWSKNCISKLIFLDSSLILPEKLAKLSESFGLEPKGKMDFEVINQCRHLHLLRDEILEYNKKDCLLLHQVLSKFADLIYKHFNLDLHKYPTLSSLALAIFLSNFLEENSKISITDTYLYDKIKSGYTGGSVDIYKHMNPPHTGVYSYDVNSLYPSVMANFSYPVGTPRFFEGSQIDLTATETFGFLKVKVTAPKDLNIPLLQLRRDGKTISPLGTWTDWYFSEELKLALTLGYKFEILEGVLFERGNPFINYVQTLYNLRRSYSKNDPMNLICKLLLNGLYGRFGMSPHLNYYKMVDYTKIQKLPQDILVLNNHLGLSSYEFDRNINVSSSKDNLLNISLPVAMAVTAYGRMHMYQYKQSLGENLFYSDTDSIFSAIPLQDKHVGKELGQMKLEYIGTTGIFVAPKVYLVKLLNGNLQKKVKGLKEESLQNLSLQDFENLLSANFELDLKHTKFFKNANTLNLFEILYNLKLTENKRAVIYVNNKASYTKPFLLNE